MTMTTREVGSALARTRVRRTPSATSLFKSLAGTAAAWRRRLAERALLARMDEREIRDLGISVSDVMMEINKPFWRE